MMLRRRLALGLGAAMLAPRSAFAQDPARTYRLGLLLTNSAVLLDAHWIAFFRRLDELGFVEGRNLVIERRNAENRLDRVPVLAAELAALKCDVFFAGGTATSLAALSKASPTTPIVAVAVDFDPVTAGDVASLARPGGRVTGVTAMQSTMPAKRLELMREMLPQVGKVAVFSNNETAEQLAVVQSAARRLGLALQVIDFKSAPFDYDAGFANAVAGRADALFVPGSGLWVPGRRTIVEGARKARLPSVFHHSTWVEAGGLMSYGFSFPALWRRGAEIVAMVLRGTPVRDIPMEQPTTFQLAINLATARALGVAIPQSLLVRADEVIQ